MSVVHDPSARRYLIEVLAHERFAKMVLAKPALDHVDVFAVILSDGRALTGDALAQFENRDRIILVRNLEVDLDPLIQRIAAGNYEAGGVFCHGLTNGQAKVCNILFDRLKARSFYFCYGGELYARLSAGGHLALYDRKHWYARLYDMALLLRTNLSGAGGWRNPLLGAEVALFMSRLDYMTTLFPSDAAYWAKLIDREIPRLPYVYPVSDHLLELSVKASRQAVFINHSASRTGNHLFVLQLLQTQELGDLRVVLPLSYGNPRYVQRIKLYVENHAHADFEILETSLPFDQYVERCAEAVCAIYGHLRQEAVGNVFIMLYVGARVYLRRDNPLLQDLRYLQLQVFSFEDDFEKFGYNPLSFSEIDANRERVRTYVSPAAWIDYYHTMISVL